MLNFIGRGSAFNTKEGNNSAYIKRGDHLLLIDCGSDVFSEIMELNLLEGIEEIDVILTHMHPDHFGSLGDLIFYSYFYIGKPQLPSLTVTHYSEPLEKTLENMGVFSYMYYSKKVGKPRKAHPERIKDYIVEPISVKHYESPIANNTFETIAFFLTDLVSKETIYYSADCYEIPNEALALLNAGVLKAFYQDVSSIEFEGNPHLSYNQLLDSIPAALRHLVYCMHIDIKFCVKTALNDGFKVVERQRDILKQEG